MFSHDIIKKYSCNFIPKPPRYYNQNILAQSQYRERTVGPLNWNLDVCACRITHLITIMVASQLHFLASKNAELTGRSQ